MGGAPLTRFQRRGLPDIKRHLYPFLVVLDACLVLGAVTVLSALAQLTAPLPSSSVEVAHGERVMIRDPKAPPLLLLAFVVNGALTLPRALAGGDPLLLLTLELCGLALLGPLVGARPLLRRLIAGAFAIWLLLLGYHCTFEAILRRAPALYDDWRLAKDLAHYLEDAGALVLVALLVLGPLWIGGGSAALSALLTGSAQLEGVARSRWLRGWGAAGMVSALALALPVLRPLPITSTLRPLAKNAQRSFQLWRMMRQWQEGPPDQRYEPLVRRKLTHRPNVYLLMLEAYGEVLTRPPFETFTPALAQQVEKRLANRGYHTRSAYSAAPVLGGDSSFSIATMHTGVRLDTASTFASFESVSRELPSLTRFFEGNSYRTISLMPGNRLPTPDAFARQEVIEGQDLGFHGHVPPFGAAPDQYSLGFMRERLSQTPGPVFLSFMNCSTHWSWSYVPAFVEDWRTLADPDEMNDRPRYGWEPLPTQIEHRPSHDYAVAVEYEWRALLEFIESEPTDDAVFIIVGDHQPFLGPWQTPDSWLTPVHVVTRHVPTLEAFDAASFRPHLFPPREELSLNHEGLLSLIISRLGLADGQPGAGADSLPRGISLGGLKARARP